MNVSGNEPPSFETLWQNHRAEIEHLARQLLKWRSTPDNVDLLLASAQVALWQSSKKYRDSHGSSLWIYARYRVRGAMLDEIRSWDHVSRDARGDIKNHIVKSYSSWGLIHRINLKPSQDIQVAVADPEKSAIDAERRHRLEDSIDKILTISEKLVTRGILVDQVPMSQLAAELGVTAGRVSQIRSAATSKLREHLRE